MEVPIYRSHEKIKDLLYYAHLRGEEEYKTLQKTRDQKITHLLEENETNERIY